MAKRIPFIDGWEQDHLAGKKEHLSAKAGVRKYTKKKYNRRDRRISKLKCLEYR